MRIHFKFLSSAVLLTASTLFSQVKTMDAFQYECKTGELQLYAGSNSLMLLGNQSPDRNYKTFSLLAGMIGSEKPVNTPIRSSNRTAPTFFGHHFSLGNLGFFEQYSQETTKDFTISVHSVNEKLGKYNLNTVHQDKGITEAKSAYANAPQGKFSALYILKKYGQKQLATVVVLDNTYKQKVKHDLVVPDALDYSFTPKVILNDNGDFFVVVKINDEKTGPYFAYQYFNVLDEKKPTAEFQPVLKENDINITDFRIRYSVEDLVDFYGLYTQKTKSGSVTNCKFIRMQPSSEGARVLESDWKVSNQTNLMIRDVLATEGDFIALVTTKSTKNEVVSSNRGPKTLSANSTAKKTTEVDEKPAYEVNLYHSEKGYLWTQRLESEFGNESVYLKKNNKAFREIVFFTDGKSIYAMFNSTKNPLKGDQSRPSPEGSLYLTKRSFDFDSGEFKDGPMLDNQGMNRYTFLPGFCAIPMSRFMITVAQLDGNMYMPVMVPLQR